MLNCPWLRTHCHRLPCNMACPSGLMALAWTTKKLVLINCIFRLSWRGMLLSRVVPQPTIQLVTPR